jgi:hypothetical protein
MAEKHTYNNQRIVNIDKPEHYDEGTFFQLGRDEVCSAIKRMTYNEFKIWLYFMMNKANYDWLISSSAITKNLGIDRKNYKTSFNKLVEKGYVEENGLDGFYVCHSYIDEEDDEFDLDEI